MTKITELPEIVVLADDDYLTAVDVSDMSESPTGKNVKIQKQNLLAGMVVKEEIGRDTDPVSGAFVFSGISGIYDRLILSCFNLRSAAAVGSDELYLYINGDKVVANYHSQELMGENGTVDSAERPTPQIGFTVGASASANSRSDIDVVLSGYSLPKMISARSTFSSYPGTDQARIGGFSIFNEGAVGPITSLELTTFEVDILTGTAILYGERTI